MAGAHHQFVLGGRLQHLHGLGEQFAVLIQHGEELGQAGPVIGVVEALIGAGLQGGEPEHFAPHLAHALHGLGVDAPHRAVQGDAAGKGELRIEFL